MQIITMNHSLKILTLIMHVCIYMCVCVYNMANITCIHKVYYVYMYT